MEKFNQSQLIRTVTMSLTLFICFPVLAQQRHSRILKTDIAMPLEARSNYTAPQADEPNTVNARRKAWAGTSQVMTLIEETWDLVTAGSVDEPASDVLANWYSGMNIDPAMTDVPGWTGHNVHAAGGCLLLKGASYYDTGVINTPLGDYSGDLTITLKVRSANTSSTNPTLVYIIPKLGGVLNPSTAQLGEGETGMSTYISGTKWTELTYRVKNYSADNDGFIQIINYGGMYLNDVRVTSSASFIAAPKILSPTDFTEDGFTVNWEKVERAANYHVYLAKKVYTSDDPITVCHADFEDGLPADWTLSKGVTTLAGKGVDGSTALALANGESITTVNNWSKMTDLTFWVHASAADGQPIRSSKATFTIDLLADGGWLRFGNFYAFGLTAPEVVDMNKEFAQNTFPNKFYAMRITVNGFEEGEYLLLDDIDIVTGRAAKLQNIAGDYGQFAYTNKGEFIRSHTYTGLDPAGEYYYRVTASFNELESESSMQHAFGVNAPVTYSPTDIDDRGSFTAKWDPVTKGDSYTLYLYGVHQSFTHEERHVLLHEDFSKVTSGTLSAPEAVGNSEVSSLNNYTLLPGWTGLFNTMAEGMLGVQAITQVQNHIETPQLDLDNADGFYLKVKARGTGNSILVIYVDGTEYGLNFDRLGYIDATAYVPVRGKEIRIRFYDNQHRQPFFLDEIEVSQDLPAKAVVHTYLGEFDTTETSMRVSGYADYDFDNYAYAVKSHHTLEGNTATSVLSSYQYLYDFASNSNNINLNSVSGIEVDAPYQVYSVSGGRRPSLQHGLNIVKKSDGTVVKRMMR